MRILVTGGAGYIGSICVEELLRQGHELIVIDNLQEGHREAVLPEACFYEGDIGDAECLDRVFRKHEIECVIHFAAEASVGASMTDPHRFFLTNVTKGLILLETMRANGCRKIIFSSSAAIFGDPEVLPMGEGHPCRPINAYGESKLMFEKILGWYHASYGFQFNAFRYFNAAGATQRLGEAHRHESHLIPCLIQVALGLRERISIFGSDYPTSDGTCVRDYLHVADIARAHILALNNLDQRHSARYNLGHGIGYTNLEVLKIVENISGKKILYEFAPRRPGDPIRLVASSALAEEELGWSPRFSSLEDIVRSAWEWHLRHPSGYEKNPSG